eukprot:CAMPEP_0178993090 /NCGR_PEP_ID=MMETSP0795-20121207/6498_1 /TAXON_ID=88552 /ORGANISM="Amoebophrya sp., Strain Ameob2" /LENGTH=631 /DNA_ID=CAMNT_0020685087 /DNA_START=1302 /DNA_END=3198 /DNA_ORIENTATION=-
MIMGVTESKVHNKSRNSSVEIEKSSSSDDALVATVASVLMVMAVVCYFAAFEFICRLFEGIDIAQEVERLGDELQRKTASEGERNRHLQEELAAAAKRLVDLEKKQRETLERARQQAEARVRCQEEKEAVERRLEEAEAATTRERRKSEWIQEGQRRTGERQRMAQEAAAQFCRSLEGELEQARLLLQRRETDVKEQKGELQKVRGQLLDAEKAVVDVLADADHHRQPQMQARATSAANQAEASANSSSNSNAPHPLSRLDGYARPHPKAAAVDAHDTLTCRPKAAAPAGPLLGAQSPMLSPQSPMLSPSASGELQDVEPQTTTIGIGASRSMSPSPRHQPHDQDDRQRYSSSSSSVDLSSSAASPPSSAKPRERSDEDTSCALLATGFRRLKLRREKNGKGTEQIASQQRYALQAYIGVAETRREEVLNPSRGLELQGDHDERTSSKESSISISTAAPESPTTVTDSACSSSSSSATPPPKAENQFSEVSLAVSADPSPPQQDAGSCEGSMSMLENLAAQLSAVFEGPATIAATKLENEKQRAELEKERAALEKERAAMAQERTEMHRKLCKSAQEKEKAELSEPLCALCFAESVETVALPAAMRMPAGAARGLRKPVQARGGAGFVDRP